MTNGLHNKSNREALTENWSKGIYKPFNNEFKTYIPTCLISVVEFQPQGHNNR